MSSQGAGLNVRRFCSAVLRRIQDEGDWYYSSEWWDPESSGCTVFSSNSNEGNGVVSVIAHPSSRPSRDSWHETERWFAQRYAEMYPNDGFNEGFRVLGYQWRSLRFNEDTRQSTVKVMAARWKSQPGSVFFMQQPHCLAVPYLKSMVSVGALALASCNYDLASVACGKRTMRVLCIGHGGGSLPLFLGSRYSGAVIDMVEIDPLVISASVKSMGFPAFSVVNFSGERPSPSIPDLVMWSGIHERLSLYEWDAEDFICQAQQDIYDVIFIDAYDGADIFPNKLWDPHSRFLKSLSDRLHPKHGTVVVNLHSDYCLGGASDELGPYYLRKLLPLGRYISKVGRAYKDVLLGSSQKGLAFACAVPWLCNMTLVVSRGFGSGGKAGEKNSLLNILISKSKEVDRVLNMPFSCSDYIKSGFYVIE